MSDESGSATLPTVVAATMALVVFVALANLVLVQYGHGVARTAADEAVRASAVFGAELDRCAAVAASVLDQLIGGPFGSDLAVQCWTEERQVVAAVEGHLPPLIPILPAFRISVRASALIEAA